VVDSIVRRDIRGSMPHNYQHNYGVNLRKKGKRNTITMDFG